MPQFWRTTSANHWQLHEKYKFSVYFWYEIDIPKENNKPQRFKHSIFNLTWTVVGVTTLS